MRNKSEDLQLWFGLSHASWAVMPRVLMEAMPKDWQDQMAELLMQYESAFDTSDVCDGIRVQIIKSNKLAKTPDWLLNYRRPDKHQIDMLRTDK